MPLNSSIAANRDVRDCSSFRESREFRRRGENGTGIYANCVENFVDVLRIPVGVAGPLQVTGTAASGSYLVPLATTEGALVASYHRGCLALNRAGGVTAAVVAEYMIRAPGFRFGNIPDALAFTRWVESQLDRLRIVASSTSSHCQLSSLETIVEGNQVFLRLQFSTGEAAGQNMVTLAADEICSFIETSAPVKPVAAYLEANFSGDKKASAMSLQGARGKRTVAEAFLPPEVTVKVLGCSAGQLEDYCRLGAIGAVMSGTIGQQGHYANALAALYLALGQDCACVAESAIGITRMEVRDGGLYACVTLPNLVLGSVGGGTGLPDQNRFLTGMGLPRKNTARALAEITAGICLAGELSISASLAAGSFARAHRVLGRRRNHRGNH